MFINLEVGEEEWLTLRDVRRDRGEQEAGAGCEQV